MPFTRASRVAAARTKLQQRVRDADLARNPESANPRLALLIAHLRDVESSARIELSRRGDERIEIGPDSGLLTLNGHQWHRTTHEDLERHRIGTPETLSARIDERLLDLVDMSREKTDANSMAAAEQRLTTLTAQAKAGLNHARGHGDHLLLVRHHRREILPLHPEEPELVIKAEGEGKLVARYGRNDSDHVEWTRLHMSHPDGSFTPVRGSDLRRLNLIMPSRYDARLKALLLERAGMSEAEPSDSNLERARNVLKGRVAELDRLALLTDTTYRFSRHRHAGLHTLLQLAGTAATWNRPFSLRLAGNDEMSLELTGDSSTSYRLRAATGPEGQTKPIYPTGFRELSILGIDSLARLDAVVESAGAKHIAAATNRTIDDATSEFRDQVAFTELSTTGILRDPDLDVLVRDHARRHPLSPTFLLTGSGERALVAKATETPGVVHFPGVDTHGMSGTAISFVGHNLKTMADVHALIGKRLLEVAGVTGDPTNAATRTHARELVLAHTHAVTTALNDAAQDADLKLLLEHSESLALGLTETEFAALKTHPSALGSDEAGMVTIKDGAIRYLPKRTVDALITKYENNELTLHSELGPLFGNPTSFQYPAGIEALALLGAKRPEDLPAAIAARLLERAHMSQAQPTAANLAAARQALVKQIAERKSLRALLDGNHADVKLLGDILQRDNHGGSRSPSIELTSVGGKTLRLYRDGMHAYFAVDKNLANLANLHDMGIDTPQQLITHVEDALIRLAAGR